MTKYRFFIKNIDPAAGKVVFPDDIGHQIRHVLRLQPGNTVTVLDGEGLAYYACLDEYSDAHVSAEIIKAGEKTRALPVDITLFFPLSRREKIEWILQKATEVGVSAFQPFICARSLVRDTNLSSRKNQRWQAIIREAAEQSGRALLPQLMQPEKMDAILSSSTKSLNMDIVMAAAVSEKDQGLHALLEGLQVQDKRPTVGLFIGAEGGFSIQELQAFEDAHVHKVSLGRTILRMETAAIVFPALVMNHFIELVRLK